MPDLKLTELERRVLGSLPMHEHNDPEGEPSHQDLAEVTTQLAADPNAVGEDSEGNVRSLVAAEVASILESLVGRGFAEFEDGEDSIRRWRHTALGVEARQSPVDTPDLIPGPAVLDLAPGAVTSNLVEG